MSVLDSSTHVQRSDRPLHSSISYNISIIIRRRKIKVVLNHIRQLKDTHWEGNSRQKLAWLPQEIRGTWLASVRNATRQEALDPGAAHGINWPERLRIEGKR